MEDLKLPESEHPKTTDDLPALLNAQTYFNALVVHAALSAVGKAREEWTDDALMDGLLELNLGAQDNRNLGELLITAGTKAVALAGNLFGRKST